VSVSTQSFGAVPAVMAPGTPGPRNRARHGVGFWMIDVGFWTSVAFSTVAAPLSGRTPASVTA